MNSTEVNWILAGASEVNFDSISNNFFLDLLSPASKISSKSQVPLKLEVKFMIY